MGLSMPGNWHPRSPQHQVATSDLRVPLERVFEQCRAQLRCRGVFVLEETDALAIAQRELGRGRETLTRLGARR